MNLRLAWLLQKPCTWAGHRYIVLPASWLTAFVDTGAQAICAALWLAISLYKTSAVGAPKSPGPAACSSALSQHGFRRGCCPAQAAAGIEAVCEPVDRQLEASALNAETVAKASCCSIRFADSLVPLFCIACRGAALVVARPRTGRTHQVCFLTKGFASLIAKGPEQLACSSVTGLSL